MPCCGARESTVSKSKNRNTLTVPTGTTTNGRSSGRGGSCLGSNNGGSQPRQGSIRDSGRNNDSVRERGSKTSQRSSKKVARSRQAAPPNENPAPQGSATPTTTALTGSPDSTPRMVDGAPEEYGRGMSAANAHSESSSYVPNPVSIHSENIVSRGELERMMQQEVADGAFEHGESQQYQKILTDTEIQNDVLAALDPYFGKAKPAKKWGETHKQTGGAAAALIDSPYNIKNERNIKDQGPGHLSQHIAASGGAGAALIDSPFNIKPEKALVKGNVWAERVINNDESRNIGPTESTKSWGSKKSKSLGDGLGHQGAEETEQQAEETQEQRAEETEQQPVEESNELHQAEFNQQESLGQQQQEEGQEQQEE